MSLPEGPKCPKGAEVGGDEVVGAEVTINPITVHNLLLYT